MYLFRPALAAIPFCCIISQQFASGWKNVIDQVKQEGGKQLGFDTAV
jgi:hypothetical protein